MDQPVPIGPRPWKRRTHGGRDEMDQPSARELVDHMRAVAILDADFDIIARVERVLALHVPMGIHADQWCTACSDGRPMAQWVEWPCLTVRKLNGEG
jgi:hypothetical protein